MALWQAIYRIAKFISLFLFNVIFYSIIDSKVDKSGPFCNYEKINGEYLFLNNQTLSYVLDFPLKISRREWIFL